jgi:hypothetical protein
VIKCYVKPTDTENYSIILKKQRQCRFIGHVMCGKGMENLVTNGEIQGGETEVHKEKRSCMACKRQQRHFQGCV